MWLRQLPPLARRGGPEPHPEGHPGRRPWLGREGEGQPKVGARQCALSGQPGPVAPEPGAGLERPRPPLGPQQCPRGWPGPGRAGQPGDLRAVPERGVSAQLGPPSRRLSGTMTPAGGREGPAGTGARLGRWGGAPPWPSNVVVAGVDGAGGTDGEVAMAAAPDVPLGPPTATATGSSGGWERFRPSRSALRRTRSAWASSMLEEWLVTPMPIARHSSRPSLLVRPSSRASSYTRIFLAKFSASPFLGLQSQRREQPAQCCVPSSHVPRPSRAAPRPRQRRLPGEGPGRRRVAWRPWQCIPAGPRPSPPAGTTRPLGPANSGR